MWRDGLRRHSTLATLLVLLALWEIAGQFHLVAGGALPAPSAILVKLWTDRADYPRHVLATLEGAVAGFAIGNTVAILFGIVFAIWPVTLRAMRGVNITAFAIPPIALAPILTLTLSGMAPRIVLAALGCYFVTMTATVVGLIQIDSRTVDVVRAYGGGEGSILRFVRLRSAMPAILSGLRIAAPNAVLGAILAEFGGGGRWGLGAYLLGSLGRADPERLWGIGLVATAISALAYLTFALVAGRFAANTRGVTVQTGAPPTAPVDRGALADLLLGAIAIAAPFIVWFLFLRLLAVPNLIAKSPVGVVDYLFFEPSSAEARGRLLAALAQTLPITALGMAAGLGFAFLLAIVSYARPAIARALMPIALVTQTMPLVALTPLLVLLLGRGPAVILWITISVTFFPAFVTILQGLSLVPQVVLDLPRAYGASALKEMRLVTVPASLPYLFAATRLTVPRAILGVMIAEWLATGTGLGNLLNQSRGFLDYGMIWTVAAVSVILSVILYQLVVVAERRVLRARGMTTVE